MTSFLNNIDFNDLKYNLYELLNINSNSSYRKIKRAYKKLIIQFHPDKSTNLEEEIFYNISLAYKILKDEELRKKYDKWLLTKYEEKNQIDLKKSYLNEKDLVKSYFPQTNRDAFNNYNDLIEKKKKIHGINNYNDFNVQKQFMNNKVERVNIKKIKYKNYKSDNEFNNEFNKKKKDDTIFRKSSNKLVCHQKSEIQKKYASVKDYNEIYTSGSVIDESYTSLDLAFLLHPEIFFKKDSSTKEKIKKYKNQTNKLSTLNFNLVDQ